jgi:hypothetical protein
MVREQDVCIMGLWFLYLLLLAWHDLQSSTVAYLVSLRLNPFVRQSSQRAITTMVT